MISNLPSAVIARGDIVACRFPIADEPNRPGDKVRPCVVLAVHQRHDGALFVEVAYGTDAVHTSNSGFDFAIVDEAEYLGAGLKKPTRFVLRRSVVVPVSDAYLDFNHAGTAKIGSLPAKSRDRMEERDKARVARRRPNGVVVCHRPRKKVIAMPGAQVAGRAIETAQSPQR